MARRRSATLVGMTTLRRVAPPVVLCALVLVGILGIAALLGAESDGDTTFQILFTALAISFYGVLLLIAIPDDESAALTPTPIERLAFISGSVAIVTGVTLIWSIDQDVAWSWVAGFATTIAAGCAHLILLARAHERRPAPDAVYRTAQGSVTLLTLLLCGVWWDLGVGAMYQLIGILAIVDVVSSFGVLVLGDRDQATQIPGGALTYDTMARVRVTAARYGMSPDQLVTAALDAYGAPAATPPAPMAPPPAPPGPSASLFTPRAPESTPPPLGG